jgi:hypothetical protein
LPGENEELSQRVEIMNTPPFFDYSQAFGEEIADGVSHRTGFFLSVASLSG